MPASLQPQRSIGRPYAGRVCVCLRATTAASGPGTMWPTLQRKPLPRGLSRLPSERQVSRSPHTHTHTHARTHHPSTIKVSMIQRSLCPLSWRRWLREYGAIDAGLSIIIIESLTVGAWEAQPLGVRPLIRDVLTGVC